MTRDKMREILMQLFFQEEAQKDMEDEAASDYINSNVKGKANKEYAQKTFGLFRDHKEEIDAEIEKSSRHWSVKRMAKIDLAVLRVAATEILFAEETPDAVSANEAVELAKKFGTDKSASFVNGVLGKLIKNKNDA